MKQFWAVLVLCGVLCSCGIFSPSIASQDSSSGADAPVDSSCSQSVSSPKGDLPESPAPSLPDSSADESSVSGESSLDLTGREYIRSLAARMAEELQRPGMSDAEKIQAAYEEIIACTAFAPPVGWEIWRVRGGGEPPSYLENRALSPLAFGIGSCEDYAAALCLVLEEMGFSARYVPGLTISVQGPFVDHAWCAVELDGVWYHLDPQLEDNVMRENRLTYRYFLKSDQTMLADHRWGSNLLQYAALTPRQTEEVEKYYLLPDCPQDWPAPASKILQQADPPARAALEAEISREMTRYQDLHGPLPEAELNVCPPVFGWEGYGPKDD